MGYLIKKKITPVRDRFYYPSSLSNTQQYNDEENEDLNDTINLLTALGPKKGRRSKIKEADLEVIQKRLSVGDPVVKIAKDYGCSYQNIWKIKKEMVGKLQV